VVRKATSVNPEDRFETADDFRRALAGFVPPEVHPEIWLSIALKEIFSPDKDRSERRRLVESGRHLLDVGPERRAAGGANLAWTSSASLEVSRQRRWRWLMPVGVGALAGMAVLFWLRMAADRADDGEKPTRAEPSMAAPSPPPAPPLPAVAVQATAPAKPAAAPRATISGEDQASGAAPKTRSPAPANRGVEPAPAKKTDHLGLAREAFNARDWARALDEGKRAVAGGGGAEARAVVGNTLFKMGKFPEAEAEYQKALALEPGNALLRDRVSIAHARAQDAQGAQGDVDRKSAKEP